MREQTEKQFLILYGDDQSKWSKTTKAVYQHLFKGVRRVVAANDNGIAEQTICSFIKNNKYKHIEQDAILEKAERYRDAALTD